MKQAYDVISIGNATIDTFLTIHDESKEVRLNEETRELCVKFGEKIDVDRCDFTVGGNAANVSVGLARLGLQAALMAEIGKDELAIKIINTLDREHVSQQLLQQKDNMASSFTVGINFQKDRTLFVEHVTREHIFPFTTLPQTNAIFLTSLGHEWERVYAETLQYIERTNIPLFFNPGSLQLFEENDIVYQLLPKTTILFLNKEEAEQLLYHKEPDKAENGDEYMQQLLKELQQKGVKNVVVTNGNKGSYARDESGTNYYQAIINVPVVEKTGAGDAFTASFIAAWLQGRTFPEAMHWGSKNAAAVIGQIGAQAGLLTKEKILE